MSPESSCGLADFSSRAPGTPRKNRRAHSHSQTTSTPTNFINRPAYFAFYVIEHYIDDGYKFAGLSSFVRYLWGKRGRG